MKDLTLAIDLGGTNTKIALVDKDLRIVKELSVPTNGDAGPEANVLEWLALVKPWMEQNEVKVVGMGIPGPLDTDRGIILESPNLKKWEFFSFTQFIQKNLNIPCYIENDANCAALGEWSQQRVSDLVVLTLGTGLGSGVIANNRLLRGAGGLAVEAGHMTVDINGPDCMCGKKGCFEVYVGGYSFLTRFNKDGAKAATVQDIFKMSQMGDKKAQDAVRHWTFAMAVGIGNLINLFNPRKVILTGGMSQAFAQVKEEFSKMLPSQAFKHSVEYAEVEISNLQNQAGLIGAALWAQQKNERANLSTMSK